MAYIPAIVSPCMRAVKFALILLTPFSLLGLVAGYYWWLKQDEQHRYDPIIMEVAAEYGADPDLIWAIIWRESRFNQEAVGTSGERGLMQLMPTAAGEFAKAHKIDNFSADDLFKPRTNIRAGTWYITRALKRWEKYSDPLPFALAEYNAGRKNALRWAVKGEATTPEEFLEAMDFPTTKKYVLTIQSKYAEKKKK